MTTQCGNLTPSQNYSSITLILKKLESIRSFSSGKNSFKKETFIFPFFLFTHLAPIHTGYKPAVNSRSKNLKKIKLNKKNKTSINEIPFHFMSSEQRMDFHKDFFFCPFWSSQRPLNPRKSLHYMALFSPSLALSLSRAFKSQFLNVLIAKETICFFYDNNARNSHVNKNKIKEPKKSKLNSKN